MDNKNILIVFYSRTGTTKRVAEALRELFNCDLEEIIDNENRKGILGLINEGIDVFFRNTTDIGKIKLNPNNYDIVIIGSPVWASLMMPAVRTYIQNNKPSFKKVAFFCAQASDVTKGTKIFRDMSSLCEKKPLGELKLSSKELYNKEFQEKLEIFKAELLNS